jgi:hypothetical protein
VILLIAHLQLCLPGKRALLLRPGDGESCQDPTSTGFEPARPSGRRHPPLMIAKWGCGPMVTWLTSWRNPFHVVSRKQLYESRIFGHPGGDSRLSGSADLNQHCWLQPRDFGRTIDVDSRRLRRAAATCHIKDNPADEVRLASTLAPSKCHDCCNAAVLTCAV